MRDMFEHHFQQEELPSEIVILLEMSELLFVYSKNLRAMQVTCNPISLALSSEFASLCSESDAVLDLTNHIIDTKLSELNNGYKID